MIVSDLDGTLLRSDQTLSEYTKTVLNRYRAAGIKVAYATGRGGSAEQVAPAGLFDGRISMNGAIARASDQVVYRRLIPHPVARPLLTACHRRGMRVTSENSGMHYSNFAVSDLWPNIIDFEMTDFARHDVDAEKIYTPNPSSDDAAFIEQLLPDDLYFVVTADGSSFLGQIMHKDATKAKAVAALAQFWGIAKSETVTFGNDHNDVEMLRESGIGVAVANAVPEAKAAAHQSCGHCDEDGVAKWIEGNVGSVSQ